MLRHLKIAVSTFALSAIIAGAQPAQAGFFNNTAFLSANKSDENRDYIKAAKLYAKVVEGSSPELAAAAAHKLYKYHLNGMGVAKDPDAALRYLAIAAQSADPTWAKIANWEMGYQLMTGFEGLRPVKRVEAVPYFLRAKQLGSEGSSKALEVLQAYPEVILASRAELFSPRRRARCQRAEQFSSRRRSSPPSLGDPPPCPSTGSLPSFPPPLRRATLGGTPATVRGGRRGPGRGVGRLIFT